MTGYIKKHGYRDVFENCFHSRYTKQRACLDSLNQYCLNGKIYDYHSGKLKSNDCCNDWPKCQRLLEAEAMKASLKKKYI